ncbi:hypothetical protein EON67_03470 [archaeon]|nr:MAG: hypothetical protein EON67_03470 [archaeon]
MRRALTLAATLALAAAAPTGFRKLASSDARAQLKLQIAVKRSHAGVTALESALTRVADPESRTFGAHLSLEEVRALTAPVRVTDRTLVSGVRVDAKALLAHA